MISIVVPVYNVIEYLNKCVNSIKSQIEKEWELLLIDDGSTDGSGALCDELAKTDKRIRVIHKENGGVSSARNLGIDLAKGEYIMFVDSDDWLEPDLCSQLLSAMPSADIAIGGCTIVNVDSAMEQKPSKAMILDKEGLGKKFDALFGKGLINMPFSKLYKLEMVSGQRFDETVKLGEDFLFNLEYLPKCQRIALVDTAGYDYNRMNENSATRKFRESDIKQIITLYKRGKSFQKRFCREKDVKAAGELEKRLCLNGINLLQLIFYTDKPEKEKKSKAMSMLNEDTFVQCCQFDYGLPVKYDIPRKLCTSRSYMMIRLFFKCKQLLSRFM